MLLPNIAEFCECVIDWKVHKKIWKKKVQKKSNCESDFMI